MPRGGRRDDHALGDRRTGGGGDRCRTGDRGLVMTELRGGVAEPSLGSISGWLVTGAMATARSSTDNVAWLECNDYAYRRSSTHYGICFGRDQYNPTVSWVTTEPALISSTIQSLHATRSSSSPFDWYSGGNCTNVHVKNASAHQ
jgi:hypothetical protein